MGIRRVSGHELAQRFRGLRRAFDVFCKSYERLLRQQQSGAVSVGALDCGFGFRTGAELETGFVVGGHVRPLVGGF